ncbi:hypothetical protein ACTNEN_00250 [Oribacterium sp. HCP28S3_H8]|uniref:hypothetical protein n=1 Tax=Oribacterium sp. HCP28S3_H8 TaxID=3438945 RepID=UPI003F89749B
MSLSAFQSIKNEFIIENAFRDWEEYRRQVTDRVLQEGRRFDHAGAERELLIVGGGRCNDVDLTRLIEGFDQIRILDTDLEAMQSGLHQYGLTGSGRIRLQKASLTGVEEADIRSFFENLYQWAIALNRSITADRFIERSLEEFVGISRKTRALSSELLRSIPPESADVTLCIGVHSQLFTLLSYCWEVLAGNISQTILHGVRIPEDALHAAIRELNDEIIPTINNSLILSARHCVLIGTEYDMEHPVEGAWQCQQDLMQWKKVLGFHDTKIHWPFYIAGGKEYEMILTSLYTDGDA